MTINATPSQGVRCPRCDSPNTKFCYYNNYSLTQPRHFCKACRRYWTKGGALRNVPIGGGCRKNKRTKSSSSLPSSSRIPLDPFNHMEYLHPPTTLASPSIMVASPSIMGFQYPSFSSSDYNDMGAIKTSAHYSNVDYIESLSSINQDLHSKLQQQRLQGLFYEAGFCKQALPFQGAENSIKAEVCGPDATTSTHVGDDGGISKWNGLVGWNDMHQFTALL